MYSKIYNTANNMLEIKNCFTFLGNESKLRNLFINDTVMYVGWLNRTTHKNLIKS